MHGQTGKAVGDGQKGLDNSGRFGYHNDKKQSLLVRMALVANGQCTASALLVNILSAPSTSLGPPEEKKLITIWCNEALRVPNAFVSKHGLIITLER